MTTMFSTWSTFGSATVSFCEARLPASVAEPANSWSSFGYVAIGFGLAALAARDGRRVLGLIGVTGVLIGLGSFAFHATATFLGQFLDEASMFLLSGMAVTFALRRLFHWDAVRSVACYGALASSSIALLALIKTSGIPMFAAQVSTAIVVELILASRGGDGVHYGSLYAVLALFAVAFALWSLDLTRTVCSADWSHVFNGHVAWHLLSAACLVPYYRFQEQFFAPSPRFAFA